VNPSTDPPDLPDQGSNGVTRSQPAVARANGIDLVYDSFGERGDPPLLLIMGLASQMLAWDDEFCAMLAKRGFWVVRFDNRDIGLSTKCSEAGVPDIAAMFGRALRGEPVTAPYTLRDMADDTVGLLDVLGIASAHVVGASMGGAIAQLVAAHYPSRVRTLTSIMATSGAPGLPPPTPEAMAVLLTPTPTDRDAYIERYIRTWKVLRGGPAFPLDEARDVERASQLHARGLSPAGVARQLAAIVASGSRKEQLASLRVPTLVIHGDIDPLVPLGCGMDVAGTVPGAKLLIVEGMGHALPISMWPRIVDAIAGHAV
jgi:pimeloyl-ACP methyl ester carboxylesterase